MNGNLVLARRSRVFPGRVLFGGLILVMALLVGAGTAAAVTSELVPAVGMTRAVHGDRAVTGDVRLGLRTAWTRMLRSEVGVSYREDQFDGGTVKMKSWPVTASLWVAPYMGLYAGGGIGWYNESTRFGANAPFTRVNTQKFGEHVGVGYEAPLAGPVGLDVNFRYVWLQKSGFEEINRNNWITTIGATVRI